MKPLRLNIIVPGLVLAAVFTGCEHKKQPLIVPQQQPPTVAPSPSPTPEATPPQTAEQPEKPQEAQPSAEQQSNTAQPQQKEADKHGHKPSPRKPAGEKPATEVARNSSGRKVVPAEKDEPIAVPGPIVPGPTPADSKNQGSTDQLLQVAESNLNGIKRTLSKDEEVMRAQIRDFINQSRKATTENDPARAYNLALKARVLSDELVKQR